MEIHTVHNYSEQRSTKTGSHWLPLSKMKLKSANKIEILNSAFTSMSFPTQKVVCQLLRDGPPMRVDKILLNENIKVTSFASNENTQRQIVDKGKFMNCAYQNNSGDCGCMLLQPPLQQHSAQTQPHRSIIPNSCFAI